MQRIRWWSAAVLSGAVAVAGCGGVSPQDAVPPEGSLALSHEQEQEQHEAFTKLPPDDKIFPLETGVEIDWVPLNNAANAQHYVWLPAARRENGKLFVPSIRPALRARTWIARARCASRPRSASIRQPTSRRTSP